jgi:hypothetical protein
VPDPASRDPAVCERLLPQVLPLLEIYRLRRERAEQEARRPVASLWKATDEYWKAWALTAPLPPLPSLPGEIERHLTLWSQALGGPPAAAPTPAQLARELVQVLAGGAALRPEVAKLADRVRSCMAEKGCSDFWAVLESSLRCDIGWRWFNRMVQRPAAVAVEEEGPPEQMMYGGRPSKNTAIPALAASARKNTRPEAAVSPLALLEKLAPRLSELHRGGGAPEALDAELGRLLDELEKAELQYLGAGLVLDRYCEDDERRVRVEGWRDDLKHHMDLLRHLRAGGWRELVSQLSEANAMRLHK